MLAKAIRTRRMRKERDALADQIKALARRELTGEVSIQPDPEPDPDGERTDFKITAFLGAFQIGLRHNEKGWTGLIDAADWTATVLPHDELPETLVRVINGSEGQRGRAQRLFAKLSEMTATDSEVEEQPLEERVWPQLTNLMYSKRYVGDQGGRLQVSIQMDLSEPEAPKYKLIAADNRRGDFLSGHWVADPAHLIVMADRYDVMAFDTAKA